MHIVIILLLVLAVLLVIFTLQNSVEVSLTFLFWEVSNVSLVLVLICCILVGYIFASIYFYPRIWKIKKEINQLVKFNDELKTLHEMNHPVQESTEEVTDPEGMVLDDDDNNNSFFKD